MKKINIIKKISIFSLSIFLITSCTEDANTFDPEHPYAAVEFETISNIEELTGKWISEDKTLIFPKTINNKDYIHVIENPKDDSELWNKYIEKNHLSVQDAYKKKYAAISEVYGIPYPLSDENGTEKGVKVKLKKQLSNTKGEFESTTEFLIPETIIDKNLFFFSISKDKKVLKLSGTFRFYSKKFNNIIIEEKYYTLEENKTQN